MKLTKQWPPRGCTGGQATCPACWRAGFTFVCARCQQTVAWCFGAADDEPEWCDDCWVLHADEREARELAR